MFVIPDSFPPIGALIALTLLIALGLIALANSTEGKRAHNVQVRPNIAGILPGHLLKQLEALTPRRIILENLVVVLVAAFLQSLVSFDFNRLQFMFNNGLILVVLASMVIGLIPLGFRIAIARVSRGDLLFARCVSPILTGVAFVTYAILGSAAAGMKL